MGIEKDRYGREIEINDEQDEMADYLRPPPGQGEITGRKPLDNALRVIRHEVINMEQARVMGRETITLLKEQIKALEEVATKFHAGETNTARDMWWEYQCRHKGRIKYDKG